MHAENFLTLEKFEMKKTLIAIAALSVTGAFAQSSVTLTGNMDAGYVNNDYKGTKVSGIYNNGSSTTAIIFKGTDDLGGGLKANFLVESDPNITQLQANTGWANSQTNGTASGISTWLNSEMKLGLSSATHGTLDVGTVNNASLTANGTGQPFGTAIGGGYNSIIKTFAGTNISVASTVRAENSIKYTSPAMNGFAAGYYYAAKQTGSNNANVYSTTMGAYDRPGMREWNVAYNQGPLNAIYVKQTVDNNGVVTPGAASYTVIGTTATLVTAAGTTLTQVVNLNTLSANYSLGNLTLGATSQTTKSNTLSINSKGNLVSAKYVMGANTFGAVVGTATNNLNGLSSKFTGAGYDYALSKTTNLYARYERLADNAVTVAAVTGFTESSTTRSRTAFGLRQQF